MEDSKIVIPDAMSVITPAKAPQQSQVPASSSTNDQNEKKQGIKYGNILQIPVIEATEGIRYDFNHGMRIYFPKTDKKYHLKFGNAATGETLYDFDVDPGNIISSVKKYYLPFTFTITRQGTGEKVFEHTMCLKDQKVIVQFPVNTIGDSIGWFSYMERFQQKHQCKLSLVVSDFLRDLFQKQYPQFEYIKPEDVPGAKSYACYYIGLFFNGDTNYQPMDFRQCGLHRTAAHILGMHSADELTDIPPRLDLSAKRSIKDKYVVIATKASTQCKYWNNPNGWHDVIKFLHENGYRVLCIDKDFVHGTGIVYNQMPWGAEDFTGEKPLQERVNLIKDADFFIGLPSGLSWLAWCCKVPVILISGFSLPNTEFNTPYRIINYDVCNGCWDDVRHSFDHTDFLWCPRHKGDDHQFECTKSITGQSVINIIKTIPTFRPAKKK